jgi:hypothetical protein
VNNFGVGGYGTDQAVLRFQRNRFDRPPVVVLGYTSENIVRNVNEFRHFISVEEFGFKPRFVKSDSGEYVLDPIVDFDVDEYRKLYLNPWNYFRHDYFIPDGPSGIPYLRFPYSVSVVRSFFSYKFKGAMNGAGSYLAPFYDPEHASGALDVTAFIIRLFQREALERGSLPVVVVIPIAADFSYYEQRKIWPYQSLLSYLNNDLKIDFVNFGEVLSEYASRESREFCDFYREEWYAKTGCTGHFNEEGYLRLARAVADELRDLGVLEGLTSPGSSGDRGAQRERAPEARQAGDGGDPGPATLVQSERAVAATRTD